MLPNGHAAENTKLHTRKSPAKSVRFVASGGAAMRIWPNRVSGPVLPVFPGGTMKMGRGSPVHWALADQELPALAEFDSDAI
jgi:hypothetical protein